MKQLLILVFAAMFFAACTTKETKETTHTETIVEDNNDAPATQPADDDPNVEINVTDTGGGMKIKVP